MRGFTLIETIILMIVVAIVVPVVMVGLNTMVIQSNRAEKLTVATDLARYYMELALSKRFDERIPPPPAETEAATIAAWTAQGSFGIETGAANLNGPNNEAAGNPTTFDDVDDFNTMTNYAIPGFLDYTLTMTVAYFTDNYATTGIWGTADSAGGARTNAKRIRVTVNNALIGNLTLDCVTGAVY